MKISSISGLIYRVKDLGKTVEFYETLGFRIGKREDDKATCYVNWFWLTFVAEDDTESAPPAARPVLYMKVDDIDDYYGSILAQGFIPDTEPRKDRSGRREFLLTDPDGNSLAFFAK